MPASDASCFGTCSFDEDRQELRPSREDRGVERVGVVTVLRGEPHVFGPGELVEQVREVAARLLVLPRTGEEGRHGDLADEVIGRERNADRVGPVLVVFDQLDDIGRLRVQLLVRDALLVARRDALQRPTLAARGRRLRVVLAILRPVDREPVVEDAARARACPSTCRR